MDVTRPSNFLKTSAKFRHVYPGQAAPTPPARWVIREDWVQQAPIRREHREERESELRSLIEDTREFNRSASEFAQSAIKTSFLLNGGGIVAIPAIIALFKIETANLSTRLAITFGFFVLGLIASWWTSFFAYFSSVNAALSSSLMATKVARNLDARFFPESSREMTAQAQAAADLSKRSRIKSETFRWIAVGFCATSLVTFIIAVLLGSVTIIYAPRTPVPAAYPTIYRAMVPAELSASFVAPARQ